MGSTLLIEGEPDQVLESVDHALQNGLELSNEQVRHLTSAAQRRDRIKVMAGVDDEGRGGVLVVTQREGQPPQVSAHPLDYPQVRDHGENSLPDLEPEVLDDDMYGRPFPGDEGLSNEPEDVAPMPPPNSDPDCDGDLCFDPETGEALPEDGELAPDDTFKWEPDEDANSESSAEQNSEESETECQSCNQIGTIASLESLRQLVDEIAKLIVEGAEALGRGLVRIGREFLSSPPFFDALLGAVQAAIEGKNVIIGAVAGVVGGLAGTAAGLVLGVGLAAVGVAVGAALAALVGVAILPVAAAGGLLGLIVGGLFGLIVVGNYVQERVEKFLTDLIAAEIGGSGPVAFPTPRPRPLPTPGSATEQPARTPGEVAPAVPRPVPHLLQAKPNAQRLR